jgi:hypothetical protein
VAFAQDAAMLKLAWISFAIWSFTTLAAVALDTGWRSYVNARFGTRIDYPDALFSPRPPPENGDGLAFEGRDGASFTISASYNVLAYTAESLEASLHQPVSGERDPYANVVFRMRRPDYLILSGFRGDIVYYDKFLFAGDHETIHHFAISYPRAAKSLYDPIVERMSRSLGYGS